MPDPGMKKICPQITGNCGNLQASPGKGRASVAKLTAEPRATRSTCVLQAGRSQRAGRERQGLFTSSSQTYQSDNLLLSPTAEVSEGGGGQKEDKIYIY